MFLHERNHIQIQIRTEMKEYYSETENLVVVYFLFFYGFRNKIS